MDVRVKEMVSDEIGKELALAKRRGKPDRITKLKEQLACDHEFKVDTRAARFGGFDIDVCERCGYEWVF